MNKKISKEAVKNEIINELSNIDIKNDKNIIFEKKKNRK